MKRSGFFLAGFALAAPAVPIGRAAELQTATLDAWKQYVSNADVRMQDREGSRAHFRLPTLCRAQPGCSTATAAR